MKALTFCFFDLFDHYRHGFEKIADDPVIGDVEYRRLGIFVYRHDRSRIGFVKKYLRCRIEKTFKFEI